jgi:simple sugar transport system permease protein
LLITVLVGVCLFALLGKDPVKGLQAFFWEPIKIGLCPGRAGCQGHAACC